MIVTAHQPHYLPWIGYFNRIHLADYFVFMDNMIYTRYSYINRNRIASANKVLTLTVPVKHNSKLENTINQVEISYPHGKNWVYKHLKSIEHNYSSSPFFIDVFPFIEQAISQKHKTIANLDYDLLMHILKYLGINTQIITASEHQLGGIKEDELFFSLLEYTHSDTILLGLGASTSYINKQSIYDKGFKIAFHRFSHPDYLPEATNHPRGISVLDLLMNVSRDNASKIVKNTGYYEF